MNRMFVTVLLQRRALNDTCSARDRSRHRQGPHLLQRLLLPLRPRCPRLRRRSLPRCVTHAAVGTATTEKHASDLTQRNWEQIHNTGSVHSARHQNRKNKHRRTHTQRTQIQTQPQPHTATHEYNTATHEYRQTQPQPLPHTNTGTCAGTCTGTGTGTDTQTQTYSHNSPRSRSARAWSAFKNAPTPSPRAISAAPSIGFKPKLANTVFTLFVCTACVKDASAL